MPKTYVENLEAIIESSFVSQVKNPKRNDIVPHKQLVDQIYFYYRESENSGYSRIYMSRNMIMELAEKIKMIEGPVVDMPFDDFPF